VNTSDLVPDSHRDLLDTNGFAFLATTGPDAAPQVNPTWYRWDPTTERLLVSLTTARQKYRNLRRDPRLAVCIPDPTNPYRYLELRGVAERIEPDRDRRFINALTKRYVGIDEHTLDGPDDVRVVVHIVPRQARCFGLDPRRGAHTHVMSPGPTSHS
jgi:PPOX class probable F420-dependent enzyme